MNDAVDHSALRNRIKYTMEYPAFDSTLSLAVLFVLLVLAAAAGGLLASYLFPLRPLPAAQVSTFRGNVNRFVMLAQRE